MRNRVKKIFFTLLGLSIAAPTIADNTNLPFVDFLKQEDENLLFSDAVRVGTTLFLSGQIGLDTKTGKLVAGGIQAETEQTLVNIEKTLHSMGYLKNDVVKCTVMLTDMNDFKKFNEAYKTFFSAPYPARSTFSVSALPFKNAKIEIECIATKNSINNIDDLTEINSH